MSKEEIANELMLECAHACNLGNVNTEDLYWSDGHLMYQGYNLYPPVNLEQHAYEAWTDYQNN